MTSAGMRQGDDRMYIEWEKDNSAADSSKDARQGMKGWRRRSIGGKTRLKIKAPKNKCTGRPSLVV